MCFGSREKDNTGAARSRELDRVIRQDEKRMQKEVKLLLLGNHHRPQHGRTWKAGIFLVAIASADPCSL